MRFVITGELDRNRLLQTIVLLYALYVVGFWLTNVLLYFNKMDLTYASVVAHYLGDEARFRPARSYQGLLETRGARVQLVEQRAPVVRRKALERDLEDRVHHVAAVAHGSGSRAAGQAGDGEREDEAAAPAHAVGSSGPARA